MGVRGKEKDGGKSKGTFSPTTEEFLDDSGRKLNSLENMYPVTTVTPLEDFKSNLHPPNSAAFLTYNRLSSKAQDGKFQKSIIYLL